MNPTLLVILFGVGVLVGATGVGGRSIMTPLLVPGASVPLAAATSLAVKGGLPLPAAPLVA